MAPSTKYLQGSVANCWFTHLIGTEMNLLFLNNETFGPEVLIGDNLFFFGLYPLDKKEAETD